MKEIKVYKENDKWIYNLDGKIKVMPMEIVATNRAKFDARNLRPVRLTIKNGNGDIVLDKEVTDETVHEI